MASAAVADIVANGSVHAERFSSSLDPEDPERAKELMKPVDVREDMKQMEARARVSQILNSQAFREQLEEIIETQTDPASVALMDLKSGPHLASWVVPQQLFQLILPAANPASNSLQSTLMAGRSPVTPVADVRGVNSALYTKGERALRCKVASVCRLLDLFGWVHGMQGSVTARVNEKHFLANPHGLMYGEMTAGSLVKVTADGTIVDVGNTCMGTRTANVKLQLTLFNLNPETGCVIHLVTSSVLAVSFAKFGLLPVSQEAMTLGDITYLDNDALITGVSDPSQIKGNVIFVRNHGLVVCGQTVEDAMFICYTAVTACDTQVRIMPLGLENIVLPSESARQQAAALGKQGSRGVNMKGDRSAADAAPARKWGPGELEFEAWMRLLDSAGYRTGYVYRQTTLESGDKPAAVVSSKSEEESAAAQLALKYYEEADKQIAARKEAQSKQRRQQKVQWLASGQGVRSGGNDSAEASPRHVAKQVDRTTMRAEDGAQANSTLSEPASAADRSVNGNEGAAAARNNSSNDIGTRASELAVGKDAQQPVPKARSSAARPKSEDPSRAYEQAASEGLLRTASDGLRPHSPSYLASPAGNGSSKPASSQLSESAAAPVEAEEKKKKKNKFRIPSFSKSKHEKKDKAKSTP